MQPITWLGLGYNLPVNPSKNRVYVWRKLKEFGAGYFKQGVAILPKSPPNMVKLTGLAAKIRDLGGEATIVELRYCDLRDETETVAKFQRQSEVEYEDLLKDCAGLMQNIGDNLMLPAERSERLRRVVKRYSKVKSRDYFRSRSRADTAAALEDLARDMACVTDEIGRQLLAMLDL